MPLGIYSKNTCVVKHGDFEPTEHQRKAITAFLNSKKKGMLFFHKLGSGKTCTSIMIAEQMLERKQIVHVYILTPGSLRPGWLNEYCRVCGKSRESLEENYTFVTYNYNIPRIPDFSNCLVIIDEAHNIINGVKNASKIFRQLYKALIEANCRILALSGTPIYNDPAEFAILSRLINNDRPFDDILTKEGIDRVKFYKEFSVTEDGEMIPRNATVITRKMENIISYYEGASNEFVPIIEDIPPIKIQMSHDQEVAFWIADIQEKKMSKPPNKNMQDRALFARLSRLYVMAKKNIQTRKVSNFYYPPQVLDRDGGKVLDTFGRDGWLSKEVLEDRALINTYSPKFAAILTVIAMTCFQKHVMFTFFKNRSGAIMLKSLLNHAEITAEIFSGDLTDSKRKTLLAQFNSKENMYGDKIRVLIVTEAGAEGISVLEARHMHIVESSPRMNKTIQAIGRVARFRSHQRLPPNERKVQVWRYWSVPSPDPIEVETKTFLPDGNTESKKHIITGNKIGIDERLYISGMKTINQMQSFLRLMIAHSVTK